MSNESTTSKGAEMKLDTAKLAEMGYGDITCEQGTIDLTDAEMTGLAESVGGTVDEIKTAEVQ